MRVYRFLFRRLAAGAVLLFGFSLLCFVIFSSIPPLILTIGDPWPLPLGSLPEASPWDFVNFSWLHFWMYGRLNSSFLEIGRFVFYLMHMFTGDYGFSWVSRNPLRLDLIRYGIPSIVLIVIAFMIALWADLCVKYWEKWIHLSRTENN